MSMESDYVTIRAIKNIEKLIEAEKLEEEKEKERWAKLPPINKLNENIKVLDKRITRLENKKHWWNIW